MQAVSLHKNSKNYTSSNPSTTKLDITFSAKFIGHCLPRIVFGGTVSKFFQCNIVQNSVFLNNINISSSSKVLQLPDAMSALFRIDVCDWSLTTASVIARRSLRHCGKIELFSIFLRNVAVRRKALAVRCGTDFFTQRFQRLRCVTVRIVADRCGTLRCGLFYVTSFVNGKILTLRYVTLRYRLLEIWLIITVTFNPR